MGAMYLPRLFRSDDEGALLGLAHDHPFATLVCGSEIAHLPCLLHRDAGALVLRTHVARPNPIAKLAEDGVEATVVFHGPHAYVSPSWYEHPEQQVPTWNYAVVHATGAMRATSSEEALEILRRLIARFEGPGGWSERRMQPGLFETIAGGIVGIEIAVTRLEGKLKLSQNRSDADHDRVRARLGASDDATERAVAALMIK
jgi:transcriptional regulator